MEEEGDSVSSTPDWVLAGRRKGKDWRIDVPDPDEGVFRVAMLVRNVGEEFYEPGDLTEGDLRRIAENRSRVLQDASGAQKVWIRPIDPDVGASGFGLGIVLDFVGVGADAIAWAGAAIYVAKALSDAKRKAEEEYSSDTSRRWITWSSEALQVIAVADLLKREGISSEQVESVTHSRMASRSLEPRLEIEEIYSVHLIGIRISRAREDVVWTYVVYADGSVVARTPSVLPGPNGPFWDEVTRGLSRLGPIADLDDR